MKNKIVIGILICFIILVVILVFLEYKKGNLGNNINISDDIDILNISSYEATVEIEVYSNKNTNKYLIKQKYLKPDVFEQEVLEPSNIKGLKIICNGENVTVQNELLNLSKMYESFSGNISNFNLVSFSNSYKADENSSVEENNDQIVMKSKIKDSQNKYQMYQNLYISKENNLPLKMEILDDNKNVTVYILYKEITVNQLGRKDIF